MLGVCRVVGVVVVFRCGSGFGGSGFGGSGSGFGGDDLRSVTLHTPQKTTFIEDYLSSIHPYQSILSSYSLGIGAVLGMGWSSLMEKKGGHPIPISLIGG